MNENEFTKAITKIFVAPVDEKLQLTFRIFDVMNKGQITEEMVKHVLQHCNFEGIAEDTTVEGEQSPQEGKYSVNLNQYLSFVNRTQ